MHFGRNVLFKKSFCSDKSIRARIENYGGNKLLNIIIFNVLNGIKLKAQYIPLPKNYSEALKHLLNLLLQIESSERPSAIEILQYWIPLVYKNLGRFDGLV